MRMFNVEFGTALLLCVMMARSAAAMPSFQETEETTVTAAVDLMITVEGTTSLPEDSKVELRGVEQCEASATAPVNAEGQSKFAHVPQCKVVFKILIPGLETGIVLVDLAKYKGELIRIHMQSSGPAKATVLNP
jgi:hypothetical protein